VRCAKRGGAAIEAVFHGKSAGENLRGFVRAYLPFNRDQAGTETFILEWIGFYNGMECMVLNLAASDFSFTITRIDRKSFP